MRCANVEGAAAQASGDGTFSVEGEGERMTETDRAAFRVYRREISLADWYCVLY